MTPTIDAKEMDRTTKTSPTMNGVNTRLATNNKNPYRGDFKEDKEETYTKHQSLFLQDGKPIRTHMEDIADAANGYTREEIHGQGSTTPKIGWELTLLKWFLCICLGLLYQFGCQPPFLVAHLC